MVGGQEVGQKMLLKRLEKYKTQGFKSFEGFDKSDLTLVSKTDDYIQSLKNLYGETKYFIRGIQSGLINEDIVRLYHTSKNWRRWEGKRKKVKTKTPLMFWDIETVGIGSYWTSIIKSYTFPFADKKWLYDTSKKELDYYLFITFNYINRKVYVGYQIKKLKNIKYGVGEGEELLQWIQKNTHSDRKPLTISYIQRKMEINKVLATNFNLDSLQRIKKSKSIELSYYFDLLDKKLMEKIRVAILRLRDMVESLSLLPDTEGREHIEPLNPDESLEDDEIVIVE